MGSWIISSRCLPFYLIECLWKLDFAWSTLKATACQTTIYLYYSWPVKRNRYWKRSIIRCICLTTDFSKGKRKANTKHHSGPRTMAMPHLQAHLLPGTSSIQLKQPCQIAQDLRSQTFSSFSWPYIYMNPLQHLWYLSWLVVHSLLQRILAAPPLGGLTRLSCLHSSLSPLLSDPQGSQIFGCIGIPGSTCWCPDGRVSPHDLWCRSLR